MARRTNKYLKPLIIKPIKLGKLEADAYIAHDMWWLLLIRGILLVSLGMFAILWPGVTLLVLATIFGIYLLVNGVIDVIIGTRSIHHMSTWFLKVLLGVLEITVGVYVIDRDEFLAIATFILLLGIMILFQGIVDIVTLFKNSQDMGRRPWLLLGGLLSFVVGLVLLRQPAAGALAFTWLLGFWGIFGGGLVIGSALGMRK